MVILIVLNFGYVRWEQRALAVSRLAMPLISLKHKISSGISWILSFINLWQIDWGMSKFMFILFEQIINKGSNLI